MAVKQKAQPLYRILDFSHVVQIFEKGELYFANPSSWDDPYETLFKHSKDHALFAQCWSHTGTSDAMWRIYSKNGMGVRISTTEEKLKVVMRAATKANGYKYRLKEVSYCSQKDLELRAAKVASNLSKVFAISEVVDMLYLKRLAFNHEGEWRATLFCPSEPRLSRKKGLVIKVDPHYLIDRILLDPRAPAELVEAFKFYFKSKLGFSGVITRCALYKIPTTYEVRDDTLDVDDL